MIAPAPVAEQFNWAQVRRPDGSVWVMLRTDAANGVHISHMTPQQAIKVGRGLVQLGEAGSLLVATHL